MIYVNRQSVKIESVKNEFVYTISGASLRPSSTIVENYPSRAEGDTLISVVIEEKKNEFSNAGSGVVVDMSYLTYIGSLKEVRKNPSLKNINDALKHMKVNMARSGLNKTEIDLMNAIKTELDFYNAALTKIGASITYTLRYTKDSYTLAEATAELEKKDAIISS